MRRRFGRWLPLVAIFGLAWGAAFGSGIIYGRSSDTASTVQTAAPTSALSGGAPSGGGNIQIIQQGP